MPAVPWSNELLMRECRLESWMQKVLVLNTCGSLEGDVNGLIEAVRLFRVNGLETHALSIPRGPVNQELGRIRHVRVKPMEFGGLELTESGCRLTRLKLSLQSIFRVVRYARAHRIDCLYGIDRTSTAYISAAVSRLTSLPLVLNCAAWWFPQSNKLAALVHRQAARTHTCSSYIRELVMKYARTPRVVEAIHYGINLDRYDPEVNVQGVREQLGLNVEDQVVLLPGRLIYYKGHEELLEAAKILTRKYPRMRIVFVGCNSGEVYRRGVEIITDYRAFLERRVADLELHGVVRMFDRWPWHTFPSLLAAVDIVAMPSWAEPFGLVAAEAMAMGKPLVTTHSGGVPEFVPPGKGGVLVAPRSPEALADGLDSLLGSPDFARQLGQSARQVALETLDVTRYARRVAACIRTTLGP